MASPRPWTDTDQTRLEQLHAQGKTLTAIAKELDRSKRLISVKAKAAGLAWDRTRTAKATEARVLDAKARRAALQLALLADAEKLRTQLWEPAVVYNFGGKDNTYEQRTLDKPPFADQLKIMQSVGVAVDRSLKLADHDTEGSAEKVVGLLQQTAAALGLTDDQDATP